MWTNRKNTAAFEAAGLFDDTRPVTQARQIDIPMADERRRALLP